MLLVSEVNNRPQSMAASMWADNPAGSIRYWIQEVQRLAGVGRIQKLAAGRSQRWGGAAILRRDKAAYRNTWIELGP